MGTFELRDRRELPPDFRPSRRADTRAPTSNAMLLKQGISNDFPRHDIAKRDAIVRPSTTRFLLACGR